MPLQRATAAHLGKHLLFGITYLDREGDIVSRRQGHGTIIAVEPTLTVRLHGTDEQFTLPPEVADAAPGEYRLRSTGDVVVNPDLLAQWTVQASIDEPSEPQ
jgi:hypothetical protein